MKRGREIKKEIKKTLKNTNIGIGVKENWDKEESRA